MAMDHRASAIAFLLIVGFAFVELACVTNAVQIQSDANLYPDLSGAIFYGGQPCSVGRVCTWFLQFNYLSEDVDLAISVNFNPPLFYFLSTGSYNFKGGSPVLIDVPSPKEELIGRYTLDVVVTGKNLTIRGCNDFQITKSIPFNGTRYYPADNTTVLSLLDQFQQRIPTLPPLTPVNLCGANFSFATNNDFSLFDVTKMFTITTRLNITTPECLADITSRYSEAILNKEFRQISLGNQFDLFFTDGFQWYQKLYNASYNVVELIDTWIPIFPYYDKGFITSNGGSLLLQSQYVTALIVRMARSGQLDARLPRAINLLMNTMIEYKTWTQSLDYYSNGAVELAYAMGTLGKWGLLTNDTRVPPLLLDLAEWTKQWITPDYSLLDSLNVTSTTYDVSNAHAVGFAVLYQLTGDQQSYEMTLKLLNASIVVAADSAGVTGKHLENFINRNYEALMWLLDSSLPLVKSLIPFDFPYAVSTSNNTVVLPNQTIVVATDITIVGNLEVTSSGTVSVTYGNVLNITGCATLSGTLILTVKDGQVIMNDTVLLAYACRQGEFDQLVIEGNVDPCKNYELQYTPSTMSIVVSQNPNACLPPTASIPDAFPGWAIAVIVIGGLAICGAIIGIVLHFRKKEQKKENEKLQEMMS